MHHMLIAAASFAIAVAPLAALDPGGLGSRSNAPAHG
jgi:hypothetical protein